jgi:ubiquinol-cytochrome c reductase iron-sulfur subunit
MSSEVDNNRRRFLTAGTMVVGAVGMAAVAVPFLKTWSPSARAKTAGAPVEANIGKLQPGQLIIVKWRGKPVWVVRRDEKALATLEKVVDELRDVESDESVQPEYAKNWHRSRKKEFLPRISRAVSFAPAMVRNSISPDASTRAYRLRRT